jgi:hypothetical protein
MSTDTNRIRRHVLFTAAAAVLSLAAVAVPASASSSSHHDDFRFGYGLSTESAVGPAIGMNSPDPAPAGSGAGTTARAAAGYRQADFNGDGYADLAVGVPGEDVGTLADAGAVDVIYGSSSGLSSSGSQILYQNLVAGQAEAGDQFGSSLVVSDFNLDGYSDLAVGVPGEDVGNVLDAGAVDVIYGSSAGLTGTGSQIYYQGVVPGQAEAGDRFGLSLSLMPGDCYGVECGPPLLVVGVPYEDVGNLVDAGEVDVLSPLDPRESWIWYQGSTDAIVGQAEAGDRFGYSLAVGLTYLAIGVPGEDVGSVPDAGAVNVYYFGSPPSGQIWYQGKVLGGTEAKDHFGFSLSIGDFGRGYEDDGLAVGVPGEDLGTIRDAGAVNVIYRVGDKLASSGNQFWYQSKAGGRSEPGDRFGSSLAAGDFNSIRPDDLAVGVPYENVGSIADAGTVNVIFGSDGTGLTALGSQNWDQSKVELVEAGDQFGFSLEGRANYKGGQYGSDLTVGVPFEDIGTLADAGAVQVIYHGSGGLTSAGNQLLHQSDLAGQAEPGDQLGWSVWASIH